MVEVQLDIFIEEVQVQLDKLLAALDTEEILDEAGALLLNRIRTRFLAEEAPDGTKWIPSQAGLRRKAKGGTGTLYDTGRLFRSMQLAALGPNERKLFTDVPYAPDLHYGKNPFSFVQGSSDLFMGKLVNHPGFPPRPFMEINDEDIELVERLITLRIEGSVNA